MTATGRLLVRNTARVFNRYLREYCARRGYSGVN
jgi:hypothetical protein